MAFHSQFFILNLKSMMETKLKSLLEKVVRDLGFPEVTIELSIPKQVAHGDLASNVAFLLAKTAGKPPRVLAESIVEKLKLLPPFLQKAEVAGAGFINFFIQPTAYFEDLVTIFQQGKKFGYNQAGKGKKIHLEFVSANPTGPLNIVSARAAAVGDTLANLLKTSGYKVHKEYYVNDCGNQIDLFAKSLQARTLQAKGIAAEIPPEGYQGEYLKDFAATLVKKRKKYGLEDFRKEGLRVMVSWQKKSLKKFGVNFDQWFFQSRLLRGKSLSKYLEPLKKGGFLYEMEGALFFKSSALGDDKDRVVRKQDGEYSYFASDIAYHANKFERKFDKVIDLLGPDHHGYMARTRAAVEALGLDPKALTILIIQQVHLMEGETLVKMSKRAGKFITMDDLVDEVGKDVARYFFLQRAVSTPLDFDLELAKKETPENPVFYVQYAHARIASIFRKAATKGIQLNFKKLDLNLLDLPEEKELAKRLLEYPDVLAQAAQELAPHQIVFFILELAKQFQAYYSQAKQDPRYHVVDPSHVAKTQAKLYLLKNIQIVLQNALKILGISVPERMEREE